MFCRFSHLYGNLEILTIIKGYYRNLTLNPKSHFGYYVTWSDSEKCNSKCNLKVYFELDEDLNKVNDCFPSLRVLNLVGVGGLKDSKIHLLHLKSCLWTVSNASLSLTIFAPNLGKLRLNCIKPKSLVFDTPLLSDFLLSVEEAYDFRVKDFCNLENLQLESSSLRSLLGMFPSGKSIKKLTVDSLKWTEALETRKFCLEELFDVFPKVNKMATVPGQLIWEIVKKNNCFLVKEFGRGNAGVQFSKESNNLYNLNSYKHSGLANKKTVTIQSVGKDQSELLATSKTKKQNKPASLHHKSVMRKELPRMAKAVVNQVADNYYRPDLKKAALARLSAVYRSLKVAKSGVKKRNRQAVKIHGRK
ncbi:hypothetical protein CRYUN_Cryun33cG0061600 [Craigia yunnanensis]